MTLAGHASRLQACAAALSVAGAAHATALKPLDDGELSRVSGRDGLAFNVEGLSITPATTGHTTLTYGMPGSTPANPYTLTLSDFSLSRTDDASPFTDPYTLTLQTRSGLPDVIHIAFPLNASLTQRWQFAADLNVTANGISADLGNLALTDLALQGGGLDIAPPSTPGIQGVSFGLSTALSLGSLVVRPRGAQDASESFTLSGLRLADASSNGPWVLSDITRQPGLFNAVTDENGTPALHLQIAWPTTADPVPTAALSIDRVVFQSNGVTTDLGSSHIAGIQINYLDMKLRAGP